MKDENNTARKSFTKADFFLIIILLAVGAGSWYWMNQQEAGASVKIYSKNEIIAELPLDRDRTFTVANELGTNTIVIEDGSAYVTDADCPDKICEEMGKISKSGETIVCLPHKLIVEISDED